MAKYSPFTFSDGTPNQVSAARLNEIGAGIREASMGRSTTFPSSPVDGDIHVYPADTTNGIMWMFMYRAAPNDWEFIGGSSLRSQSDTDGTFASATYVDPTTIPVASVTAPFAGDFEVEWGAQIAGPATANLTAYAAIKIGAAATSDNDAAKITTWTTGQKAVGGHRKKTFSCAASDVVKVQYRGETAASWSVFEHWIFVKPVRHTP